MEKETAVSVIAAKYLGVETLETRNSDALDFHSLAVWSLTAALEAAYDAGRESVWQGVSEPSADRSGECTTMTIDEAAEHLKTWIDGLDDPSRIAERMIHVCGCPRAAVIDGTHIAAEIA